jgi:hypothetical protein
LKKRRKINSNKSSKLNYQNNNDNHKIIKINNLSKNNLEDYGKEITIIIDRKINCK